MGSLLLELTGVDADPEHWVLAESGDGLVLSLGRTWVRVLQRSLSELPKSVGDYSVGPQGQEARGEIWFWWFGGRR